MDENETLNETAAEPEQAPALEAAAEPEQAPAAVSYADSIAALQAEYEKKIAALKVEADKAIKERDAVITQLLTGDQAQAPASSEPEEIMEINARRAFTI